jgi:PTS system glucose-specific IIA component
VHLGLDTVQLRGNGFKTHVSEGAAVAVGQVITTYDVPSVVAAGLNPVIPVVVMDEREADNIALGVDVLSGAQIASGSVLFTAITGD